MMTMSPNLISPCQSDLFYVCKLSHTTLCQSIYEVLDDTSKKSNASMHLCQRCLCLVEGAAHSTTLPSNLDELCAGEVVRAQSLIYSQQATNHFCRHYPEFRDCSVSSGHPITVTPCTQSNLFPKLIYVYIILYIHIFFVLPPRS